MATVHGQIGARFLDDSNETTSAPLYFTVSDATTIAQLLTAVATPLGQMQALSAGSLTKGKVPLDVDVSAITTAPGAGSRIEATALLRATVDGGNPRTYGVDLPALEPSILVSNSKRINMANAAVDAFVTTLTGTGGTLRFTSPSGQNIDSILSGRETFRKHRRIANRS